ncbi:MAG: Rrf2 family transcriptional regulator [Desulfovibrio sp.]|jgi:Rrf2 family iron-sulfur cluster assembly transcriptional regulator|nr:Rrf2 family transcriptional regulator [Desulfovibrio sp.]
MKLKPDIRYAIRVIFTLTGLTRPVSIARLSEKTGIAPRAVELIHIVLKRNGLTTSAVGSKGGIKLAVPLAEITLGRLVEIFDDGVDFFICSGKKTNECPDKQKCAMRSVWNGLSDRIQQKLNSISLGEIFQDYVEKPPETARRAACIAK